MLRRVLDFVVEGRGKKGKLKRTWINQVEEECVKTGLRRERCTLLIKVECRHKSDCCLVEVNVASLTCWENYHI